jgi:hypothetical protein
MQEIFINVRKKCSLTKTQTRDPQTSIPEYYQKSQNPWNTIPQLYSLNSFSHSSMHWHNPPFFEICLFSLEHLSDKVNWLWLMYCHSLILDPKSSRVKMCSLTGAQNNKNKDQQGKGNVHRTPPPDKPKQDTQKAPKKYLEWNLADIENHYTALPTEI